MNKRVNEWVKEWMSQLMNEWMNKWSERMLGNERERVKECCPRPTTCHHFQFCSWQLELRCWLTFVLFVEIFEFQASWSSRQAFFGKQNSQYVVYQYCHKSSGIVFDRLLWNVARLFPLLYIFKTTISHANNFAMSWTIPGKTLDYGFIREKWLSRLLLLAIIWHDLYSKYG